VLVIAGIVIAFTIPAITNLSRSTALPGAIRQVANEASLARQYAITHRVQAAVLVNTNMTAVTVSTNGVLLDKWNYLPAGTIVYFNPPFPPFLSGAVGTNLVAFTPTGGTTYQNEIGICVREGAYENIGGGTNTYYGITSNSGTIMINNLLGRIAIQRP